MEAENWGVSTDGVYGWIGAPEDPLSGYAPLQAMVGGSLPAGHASPFLASRFAGEWAEQYISSSVHVGWAGRIHWRDTRLAELAAQGGDGRAIGEAYRIYGPKCLAHIHGVFSLAIVDQTEGSGLLAIDRAGIERLCYAETPRALIFAPTTEALLRHPALKAKIDPQGIYHYLYFHIVPSPGTIFAGVSKLLPGQALIVRRGKAQKAFYWRLGYREEDHVAIDQLAGEFHPLLRRCVKRNLEGAGRVGCFLSGGTDSSTLAGILRGSLDEPVSTFSIGFDAPGFDESFYSKLVAKRFQTNHHHYYVTPKDVADAVPRVAAAYDEPFGNASALAVYYCARLAKESGVETLVAGDGGDEIFGGNARYAKQQLFEQYFRLPEGMRIGILEPLILNNPITAWLPLLRKLRRYVEQARIPLPDRLETYNFLHLTDPEEVLHPELLPHIDGEEPLRLLREVYQRAEAGTALNRMLHLDLKITLADNDLPKVTRMCELAGVDVRYPLLDEEMLDFSGRVPPKLKVKGQKLRYFFKYAVRDLLPKEVLKKSKHGFGLPFGLWMKEDKGLGELAASSLSRLRSRQIVNPGYLDALQHRHLYAHATYYGDMIWVLIMLEQWMESHGY